MSSSLDVWLLRALEEDIGRGDVTSQISVPENARGEGRFLAKTPLVLAGSAPAKRVFELLDLQAEVIFEAADGVLLQAGAEFGSVRGRARTLLAGERLALNLLQHLSGVATLTRAYVDAMTPYGAKILDTRKTIPGLRLLEKAAVKAGGGVNHRFGLDDGILIKDNHIALAGGLEKAVSQARRERPNLLRIEVEVSTLEDAETAISCGADMLLLDNMTPAQMRTVVERVAKRVLLEASGGISLETVGQVAASGVDFISVGRLTHSAPAADINLKFRPLA